MAANNLPPTGSSMSAATLGAMRRNHDPRTPVYPVPAMETQSAGTSARSVDEVAFGKGGRGSDNWAVSASERSKMPAR